MNIPDKPMSWRDTEWAGQLAEEHLYDRVRLIQAAATLLTAPHSDGLEAELQVLTEAAALDDLPNMVYDLDRRNVMHVPALSDQDRTALAADKIVPLTEYLGLEPPA